MTVMAVRMKCILKRLIFLVPLITDICFSKLSLTVAKQRKAFVVYNAPLGKVVKGNLLDYNMF